MMPFTEACCELLRIPLPRTWVNKGAPLIPKGTRGSTAKLDGPCAAVHRHRLPAAKPERRVPGPDHRRDAVFAGDEGGVGGEGAAVCDHGHGPPEQRGPRGSGEPGDEHLPVSEAAEVFRAAHDTDRSAGAAGAGG